MLRVVLIFSALLLGGSLGAFFLFVPPLVIGVAMVATVALLLTGYTLLYCLSARPERKH
jgi:hypothetical protein